ncbi:hypothetical protein PoB_003560300 [Plakobranchus ocellatus]|uniref:MATH domain-containing protein n=1 Tax=Plakobranchus ocellatus TaxID=259542 RepID=A0AAV4AP16_9GAST|nr:hypothetical protein PoB_003560300 [Plakobranchus ocellatus]
MVEGFINNAGSEPRGHSMLSSNRSGAGRTQREETPAFSREGSDSFTFHGAPIFLLGHRWRTGYRTRYETYRDFSAMRSSWTLTIDTLVSRGPKAQDPSVVIRLHVMPKSAKTSQL